MSDEDGFTFTECRHTGMFYAHEVFPKTCGTCGAYYVDHEEFVQNTVEPEKGVFMEDCDPALMLEFRNCRCGSTLACMTRSRRDISEQGDLKREQFADALDEMVRQGVPLEEARENIREIIRYVKSIGIYKE